MEYRHLGSSGLQISELSLGSWITFGGNLDLAQVKTCMRTAFDLGINFFDNAEAYGSGASELLMGEALRDYKREELIISTKIFWGGSAPNQEGLSYKHIIEGCQNSLRRLQTDYVDLIFCHRPDPTTPIEETVRAMDHLIHHGLAFYWGTSEWSAEEIAAAHKIAEKINARPPLMEQPEYSLLHRHRFEKEYLPLYKKYGMGTTIWSPLAGGILTGKYSKGLPPGSRLQLHPELARKMTDETNQKVLALEELAKTLNCSLAQLSLAWCLKNPHVSTVITGATTPSQVQENMEASTIKAKLTNEVMEKIDQIVGQGE